MFTVKKSLSKFEAALESNRNPGDFDSLCLAAGLSPVDMAEILFEQTGYDWRNINFFIDLNSVNENNL